MLSPVHSTKVVCKVFIEMFRVLSTFWNEGKQGLTSSGLLETRVEGCTDGGGAAVTNDEFQRAGRRVADSPSSPRSLWQPTTKKVTSGCCRLAWWPSANHILNRHRPIETFLLFTQKQDGGGAREMWGSGGETLSISVLGVSVWVGEREGGG